MLHLIARQSGATFAIDAGRIIEILPWIDLNEPIGESERVSGLLTYRGRVLPTVDLGPLVGKAPSKDLLSARILVVDDPRVRSGTARHALLVQALGDMTRLDAEMIAIATKEAVKPPKGQRFLGPVVPYGDEPVRILYPERVLDY